LDTGLYICKAGALLLESCLQSILLWLFWRTGLTGWPQTTILPISSSQVARITGVSHQHLVTGGPHNQSVPNILTIKVTSKKTLYLTKQLLHGQLPQQWSLLTFRWVPGENMETVQLGSGKGRTILWTRTVGSSSSWDSWGRGLYDGFTQPMKMKAQ
jgi:hypothetical protein